MKSPASDPQKTNVEWSLSGGTHHSVRNLCSFWGLRGVKLSSGPFEPQWASRIELLASLSLNITPAYVLDKVVHPAWFYPVWHPTTRQMVPKIFSFDAGSNWIKWSHFLQRFFGIRCTIAAGGPARAARLGPRPQSPAAMVQRIPRNLRRKPHLFCRFDVTSNCKK